MKNKSKLKKIKEKKNTGTNVPAQWLYLCPQEITVRDIWTTVNDLFYVSIHQDSFSIEKPVMEHIAHGLQGMFCGDTDDFTPVIRFA